MGEENESFYDNPILESIRNNQEILICRIENTPETPLNGSTPYLPSENIRKHQKTWKMYGPYQSKIPVQN